jgi:hypothetical protein
LAGASRGAGLRVERAVLGLAFDRHREVQQSKLPVAVSPRLRVAVSAMHLIAGAQRRLFIAERRGGGHAGSAARRNQSGYDRD